MPPRKRHRRDAQSESEDDDDWDVSDDASPVARRGSKQSTVAGRIVQRFKQVQKHDNAEAQRALEQMVQQCQAAVMAKIDARDFDLREGGEEAVLRLGAVAEFAPLHSWLQAHAESWHQRAIDDYFEATELLVEVNDGDVYLVVALAP